MLTTQEMKSIIDLLRKNKTVMLFEHNDDSIINDKSIIQEWIKQRFNKLRDIEDADVWMENEVFFTDDPTDRIYGFNKYVPTSQMAKRCVHEIRFLLGYSRYF